MKRMDLNAALLPDADLSASIVTLSKRLAGEAGSTLVLDAAAGPFPHLTLYLTGYPDDCEGIIPVLLEGNIRHLAPTTIHVTGVAVSAQGSVLLNVEKTRELDRLHRWMIHKLNPMRMDAKPQIWEERRARYGEGELKLLDSVGFPTAHDAWSPHFTIGRVAPEAKERALAALGHIDLRGRARAIGIGRVGEHGAFTQVTGEAKFGRSVA